MKTHGLPIVAVILASLITLGTNHFFEATIQLLILIEVTSMVVIFAICSYLWSLLARDAQEMGLSTRETLLMYVIGAILLTLVTTPWVIF